MSEPDPELPNDPDADNRPYVVHYMIMSEMRYPEYFDTFEEAQARCEQLNEKEGAPNWTFVSFPTYMSHVSHRDKR